MNQISARLQLDAEIEAIQAQLMELEGRLNSLQEIQSALQDPKVADTLSRVFSFSSESASAGSSPRKATRKPLATHRSHYEKIVEFFRSRKNEPATAVEVAAGIGIKRSSARDVLGRSNKDEFLWDQTVENEPKRFHLKKFP